MNQNIGHNMSETKGVFEIKRDDEVIGELTYSIVGDSKVIIDHTFVYDSKRGTGAGMELVMSAAYWAREEGFTVIPLCSFAKAMFERTEEIQDLL